jgi:hypothetical protein
MAGLLDMMYGTPDKAQAMGLLAQGLLSGNFGAGLGAASQFMGQAPQRELDRQMAQKRMGLLDMQIDETKAQAEERKAKLRALEAAQARQDALIYGTGSAPAAATIPGAGGMGPIAPQSAVQGQGGVMALAKQLGIPAEAIQADITFNGGKKVAELLADRSKPNWQNINGNLVNTAAPGFQGGFQPGMNAGRDGQVTMWQPDGQGGVVVGAPRGALETYGAYQNVGEAAKAGRDLVEVVGADGAKRFVTREQAVSAARPNAQVQPRSTASQPVDSDRAAIYQQELTAAQARLKTARSAEEINRATGDIAALRRDMQGLGIAAGPMQTSLSTSQEADAAAAKVRAEADARSASGRADTQAKKVVSAQDTLSNIRVARELLAKKPTSSMVGAGVDAAQGFFGGSNKGADAAAQLETLSGWMVANVPRMEGPQSNFDVKNYQTMAALVGDRTKPLSQRLKALETLEQLQMKYAPLNGAPNSGGAEGDWGGGGGWQIRKKS